MRSYLSLIPITARVRRRQNRMTRICIILAVFLVTSVFSLAEMWTNSETEAMRQNHGDWHIMIQQVSEDVAAQITKDRKVAFSARQEAINADEAAASLDYSINGKKMAVYGVEETYLAMMMGYSQEGAYPQSSTEVALSAVCKKRLQP